MGTDSKIGAQVLGNTKDSLQGSESWISGSDRISRAVGGSRELTAAVEEAIAANRIESWVVTVRPDGSTFVQVLDANGKPKLVNTSKIVLPGNSNSGAKP